MYNNLNFPLSISTLSQQKSYIPKGFNPFSKSLPQLEDVEGGHLGGKFQVRRYFTFAMARWKLCASTTLEISHIQPVHCACKNPISPKVFNRFSKSLPQLEDFEGGHLGGKVEARRYFTFAMAKWKLCASTTFEILPLSTCSLCQQKSYISKGIQPIFGIFASARRLWGWAYGYKGSGAQVFYFCNGNVKTLRMYNIWNFPISSCTLCLQKSYISKGIQPIFEIFATARRFWGLHLGGMFQARRYFTFAMARWKLCACTTFEISHFQPVHCHSKNPISPKVLNRFSKCLPQPEDVDGGHLGGKFQAAATLLLQWQGKNFAHRKHLKFCNFQPVHCASKNAYSPNVFNLFSKS